MKNYPHILAKVYGEPWIITPEKHSAIRAIINSRLGESAGDMFRPPMDKFKIENFYPTLEPKRFGSTLIIPVHGVIGQRLSLFEISCGGVSLDYVCDHLKVGSMDKSITRILLDFDSPGGTVTGVPECADLIAKITETKEVIAFTETACCSGAYWLASQCSEIYCTGSSRVGSIGVYSIFEDWTEALKEEGIKINAISAGEMKLAGAYFKPMTDKERAMFQSRTDKIYSQFKSTVSKTRGLDDDSMQGQVFDGEDAKERNLVDAIIPDMDSLIR